MRYKMVWVGSANALYDRAKLLSIGSFSFWQRLLPEHAGEEVVVQFLLIYKYDGCGILSGGTDHPGLPARAFATQRARVACISRRLPRQAGLNY